MPINCTSVWWHREPIRFAGWQSQHLSICWLSEIIQWDGSQVPRYIIVVAVMSLTLSVCWLSETIQLGRSIFLDPPPSPHSSSKGCWLSETIQLGGSIFLDPPPSPPFLIKRLLVIRNYSTGGINLFRPTPFSTIPHQKVHGGSNFSVDHMCVGGGGGGGGGGRGAGG